VARTLCVAARMRNLNQVRALNRRRCPGSALIVAQATTGFRLDVIRRATKRRESVPFLSGGL
jgi:hypothetical protein